MRRRFCYWGFNQYIIQRALVVFPGIAAFVLTPNLQRADQAYPTMMSLAPVGVRGLILAALIAAIVSSLGSMMNSIATIFTCASPSR